MRQKGFIFLPVILVVVLLGVLGYFTYHSFIQDKEGESSPSVFPSGNSKNPTITIDPKTGWKIYVNDNYHFTFSYPNSSKIPFYKG